MKQKMLVSLVFCCCAALGTQANNYTVKSPDGKLAVNVACEGGQGFLYGRLQWEADAQDLRLSDW